MCDVIVYQIVAAVQSSCAEVVPWCSCAELLVARLVWRQHHAMCMEVPESDATLPCGLESKSLAGGALVPCAACITMHGTAGVGQLSAHRAPCEAAFHALVLWACSSTGILSAVLAAPPVPAVVLPVV
jgi:hypothetical protein